MRDKHSSLSAPVLQAHFSIPAIFVRSQVTDGGHVKCGDKQDKISTCDDVQTLVENEEPSGTNHIVSLLSAVARMQNENTHDRSCDLQFTEIGNMLCRRAERQ